MDLFEMLDTEVKFVLVAPIAHAHVVEERVLIRHLDHRIVVVVVVTAYRTLIVLFPC